MHNLSCMRYNMPEKNDQICSRHKRDLGCIKGLNQIKGRLCNFSVGFKQNELRAATVFIVVDMTSIVN